MSADLIPAEDCLVCAKHLGAGEQPLGGYLFADRHWRVSHAPPSMAAYGQLVVESVRHFHDFGDMTDAEAGAYGLLLRRLYRALRDATGPERVYTVALLEGPHFHVWLVPRPAGSVGRGLAFLETARSSEDADVRVLVQELRGLLDER